MAADNPLSKAEFLDGSYHFPPGARAPRNNHKPCSFYNTSTCLKGAACTYDHDPDEKSLRLILDVPNICKDHLLAEHGCKFSKKGRRCWYSHDLSKAGLPLHDKTILKKALVQLESQVQNACISDLWTAFQALDKLELEGKITEAQREARNDELNDRSMREVTEWVLETEEKADKILAQVRSGGAVEDPYAGKAPVIDVKGLSGADVLRLCGVEHPFPEQKERKDMHSLSVQLMMASIMLESDFDEDDDFNDNFNDDEYELLCQGVKPWDDDAADVLAVLRGF